MFSLAYFYVEYCGNESLRMQFLNWMQESFFKRFDNQDIWRDGYPDHWAPKNDDKYISQLVVRELKENVSPDEESLFARFANNEDERKFECLSCMGWFENWSRYSKALVQRAKRKGLPFRELMECLSVISPSPKSDIALVPVCAYFGTCNGEKAWIIICKWESMGFSPNANLIHVRIWVVGTGSKKVLGYSTCS